MAKQTPKMKSLDDIKMDMSTLYNCVNSDEVNLKKASELANIAGKYLKAEQLQLAREIFMGQLGKRFDDRLASVVALRMKET